MKPLMETQALHNDEQPALSLKRMLFENLMTVESLARDMERSKQTIYGWVRQGCPVRRIKGRVYFEPKAVAEWLQRTST
jgi:hypothetical protein